MKQGLVLQGRQNLLVIRPNNVNILRRNIGSALKDLSLIVGNLMLQMLFTQAALERRQQQERLVKMVLQVLRAIAHFSLCGLFSSLFCSLK